MRVVRVRRLRGRRRVRVYDLTVAPTHRYAVGPGVVVSNSKRISVMDVNALLAAGAVETLRGAAAVRGQRNDQFWYQFMQGHLPRTDKVPFVYEKFLEQLKAAGINVVRRGFRTHVLAMTNKDVEALTEGRILQSAETVHFDKDHAPVPGGLFDPRLTGGHGGRLWSAIPLAEPMPNPVMEEPIRRILNLTRPDYEAVLTGRKELPGFGSGPEAIAKALKQIDLDREIEQTRTLIRDGARSQRDRAVRRLGYLLAAKKHNLHPGDWVLDKVPVLPPAFRPVGQMGATEIPLVADANYLYRELWEANENLRQMRKLLGPQHVADERAALYNAFRAVVGLADPVHPKLREKRVQGILASIFGSSPKFGTVQRKLISSTVDNVGRAVIVPDPDYDMDQVGIPEDKAFDVYGRFVARRLVRRGLPLAKALEHVRDRTELARSALLEEMRERPVIVNRAPVLHRYGILALKPQLVKDHTMHINPLVLKGLNADFDGDAMQFHVPTLPEEVKEALERLLPSRDLISPADFKTPVHAPVEEDLLAGLHAATSPQRRGRVRVFRSSKDALAAWKRGEISVNDEIQVLGP